MIRKIIKIDEEKCNGCGACAAACHEGAIEMIDGKAKLTREDYCDGLVLIGDSDKADFSMRIFNADWWPGILPVPLTGLRIFSAVIVIRM